MDIEEASKVINEWGIHNICYAQMIRNENITEDEAVELSHYGPRNGCFQFAAIYRKNDHNYIWRGRRVPDVIRGRLKKLLVSNDPEEHKQGTMLLYKTGGNSRKDNRIFYPIRLSDNRYSFQMGSLVGLRHWLNVNYETATARDALDILFRMWSLEHLLDVDIADSAEFKRRSYMAFLMDKFVNTEKYKELFHSDDVAGSDEITRATHCVWKDGEIIEWERCGQNIHPKI